MPEFQYQDPFPQGKDDTKYRLLTKEYVSVSRFDEKEVLVVDPEGLAFLANQAFRNAIGFQRLMQAICPLNILVAVADEATIFVCFLHISDSSFRCMPHPIRCG